LDHCVFQADPHLSVLVTESAVNGGLLGGELLLLLLLFYGPPQVPRCHRSRGVVRPLRWAPDHQSGDEDSSFKLECRSKGVSLNCFQDEDLFFLFLSVNKTSVIRIRILDA
jgi:hypothetical protein